MANRNGWSTRTSMGLGFSIGMEKALIIATAVAAAASVPSSSSARNVLWNTCRVMQHLRHLRQRVARCPGIRHGQRHLNGTRREQSVGSDIRPFCQQIHPQRIDRPHRRRILGRRAFFGRRQEAQQKSHNAERYSLHAVSHSILKNSSPGLLPCEISNLQSSSGFFRPTQLATPFCRIPLPRGASISTALHTPTLITGFNRQKQGRGRSCHGVRGPGRSSAPHTPAGAAVTHR